MSDAVMLRIAELCSIPIGQITGGEASGMSDPYVIVQDQGERQVGGSDFRSALRRFRVRFFSCSKGTAVGLQNLALAIEDDASICSAEGWGCPVNATRGATFCQFDWWRSELVLNFRIITVPIEPVAGNWILAGGMWNDAGVWDDLESWED